MKWKCIQFTVKTTAKKKTNKRTGGDEKDEWRVNDGGNMPYIGFVF